jgi:hypothetical protein
MCEKGVISHKGEWAYKQKVGNLEVEFLVHFHKKCQIVS